MGFDRINSGSLLFYLVSLKDEILSMKTCCQRVKQILSEFASC